LPDGAITLVQTVQEAEAFQPRDASKLAYVTQTTLSLDDTADIVTALKRRFGGYLRIVRSKRASVTVRLPAVNDDYVAFPVFVNCNDRSHGPSSETPGDSGCLYRAWRIFS
jgi:hypothetical protein